MSGGAKGSVALATLDFVRAEHGEEPVQTALATLDVATRRAVESVRATDELPLRVIYALWRALDDVLASEHPQWAERAGAHSITLNGEQLYSGILRKPDPLAFLTQPVSLFRLFYHSGDMDVVERSAGRAVLRLHDFEDVDVLFCRRMTGGLRRTLELSGGAEAVARHVRCATEGDAYCEWELIWRE